MGSEDELGTINLITPAKRLEDLARTAARLSRREFLLTIAPLRGSPVNPVAVF